MPIVTSAQILRWLDGRNGSSFGDIAYSNGQLTFSLSAQGSARGLQAMLPARSASGPLTKLRAAASRCRWKRRTVKGVDYVMFDATAGAYTATYANDTSAPEISGVSATADAEGHADREWTTDEPSTSIVEYGRTAALGSEREDTAEVTEHRVELTGLSPGTTYRYRVSSADSAGNAASSPATPGTLHDAGRRRSSTRGRPSSRPARGPARTPATRATGPDGEVQLQPTVGDEFSGSALSATWLTRPWQLGRLGLVPRTAR